MHRLAFDAAISGAKIGRRGKKLVDKGFEVIYTGKARTLEAIAVLSGRDFLEKEELPIYF
jgi:hypothetical protein